ncbi:MAG TPA: DUF945 family protein [Candidatus Binataceae bacterium]|nr:DUF945 family protein [Candidatus Binataceae bacterium]
MNSKKLAQPGFSSRGAIDLQLIGEVAIALLLIVFVVLPWPVGMKAEAIFRQRIADLHERAQTSGYDVEIKSYDRGWFGADTVTTVDYHGHSVALVSRIMHGPFVLSGENASMRPVAAVISTNIELPPELKSALSNVSTASSEPAADIRAIIKFSGIIDVHAHVAPFTLHIGPGLPAVNSSGAMMDLLVSNNYLRGAGTLDEVKIETDGGTANFGKTEFETDSARDESGLWLGTTEIKNPEISSAQTINVPNRGSFPLNFDLHDVQITTRAWREGATIQSDHKLSIARAQGFAGIALAINASVGFANLDPDVLVGWSNDVRETMATVNNRDQQMHMMADRALALLVALSKNDPRVTANINVTGDFNASGNIDITLKSAMASDSSLAQAPATQENWTRIALNYLTGSGDVKLPATLTPFLADPMTKANLVDEGFFAVQGDSVVSSANYADGHLSVRGRQIF